MTSRNPRRIVLLPGASTSSGPSPPDQSAERTERMEVDPLQHGSGNQPNACAASSSGNAISNNVKQFVAKCRMLVADLETSAIAIEQLLEESSLTSATINLELAEIQKMVDTYAEAHCSIMEICEIENLESKPYTDRRQRFLMRYKKIRNQLLANLPATTASQKIETTATSSLKLPRVEIPTFEGDFEQWSSWFKLFESLVHKNETLDDMNKFSFLRSRLKGVPLSLVECYPFEGEFYETAFNTVVCHYNDPLKRISRILDTIQNSASMKDRKQSLRGLITLFRANATALQITFQQNVDIDPLSQLLIHSFLSKADKGTRQDWEREITRRKKFATFAEFVEYMEGRCNAYERATVGSNVNIANTDNSQRSKSSKVLTTLAKKKNCYHCSRDHPIYKCPDFIALSISERQQIITDKKLCRKCLSHRCKQQCKIYCSKCKGTHNLLLHEARANNANEQTGNKNLIPTPNDFNLPSAEELIDLHNSNSWIGSTLSSSSEALLATVQLEVCWPDFSKTNSCRGLLDSASQPNLITSKLVKLLKLKPTLSNCNLNSIENHQSSTQGCVQVQISAKNTEFVTTVWCEIVDDIVDQIPNYSFDIQNWKIPKNVILADTAFNISDEIDLLLGLRIFWKILGTKKLHLGNNLPCLRSSKFGWLVADDRGELERPAISMIKGVFATQIKDSLSETFERFWLLDELESKTLSFEELECENFYLKTTIRNIHGRFIVKLPFGLPPQKLGLSRAQALKRFYQLEKRLTKNPKLQKEYADCIEDYITQGHMKEINENELAHHSDDSSYYMPHHAVIKETSTSTRLRSVFDASMPTTTGLSLNQCLMVGPVVQSDLISVIMRFRVHKVVFTADIIKMYRQILLDPQDTRFQRIFWRSKPTDSLKVHEITTLAFGTASAPYLATRCLKALADLDGEKFPAARPVLLRDFYVDDVLTGANSVKEALKIQKQLQEILEGGGFKLSKWCSNYEELLFHIPPNQRETNFPFSLDKDDKIVKTLGLLWSKTGDSYKVKVTIDNYTSACNKRDILSIIASIFDPLGLLSPITVNAKLLIQLLWCSAKSSCSPQSKNHWNENVSEEHRQQWIEFASNLHLLHDLSVPRCLFDNCDDILRVEIHGFSDASERAYGAAVYIRAIGKNELSSRLFCAKSRVAPIKKQSVPRLELCAALLLSEMLERVKSALSDLLKIDIIRLWTDSHIVLHWIGSASNRWLPFVANRVQKIQNLTTDCFWDYVHTKSNPADLVSRGTTPTELRNASLWWQGPEWLLTADYFTSAIKFVSSKKPVDVELRHSKRALSFMTVFKSSVFQQFSNYWKLVKTVAWISRFCWNSHWLGPHISGPLQVFELRDSIHILVKLAQMECFSVEYKRLQSDSEVDKSSPLAALSPFLDHHNIIRVGGRLQNSELSFNQQHPYVLDPHHKLSELLIRHYHELHYHAGPQLLRSLIRNQFWILRINSAIRHCITHCHKCIRVRAETRSQTMAALPKSRVTPSKPFLVTGVDYAGPFSILGKGGKHKVMVKAYIAVFVCFTTKAIHLELVSDLTSEAFLAALTRFISRRGIPVEIHSDNGTNFVGAQNLLKKQFKEFLAGNYDDFSKFAASKGCQWHFIPPHAPHFGGLWEAGVKAVKAHLRFALSKSTFTFEQWATLLTQIEAYLNSRPLIPESTDPNEISALTPGHFLIGGPMLEIPYPDLKNVPENRLKHWELVKAQVQKFWKRWSNEYLNTLQQRSKWKLKKDAVKINDLVIIREENTPPCSWPLGRIEELHSGSDGLTRVVTLRTASGLTKRPIVKIILLPTTEST